MCLHVSDYVAESEHTTVYDKKKLFPLDPIYTILHMLLVYYICSVMRKLVKY